MSTKQGLYAYGLVSRSPTRLDIAGIDKKNKVYPVEGRDICVIVSKTDIDQFQHQVRHLFSELTTGTGAAHSEAETILQAHEDVVDALMQETTVVPFKFGTLLKDEQAALQMLQDYEEPFKELLAKFSGRAEWGLKVYADQQEFIKQSAQIEPGFKDLEETRAKLSRGTAYLLGRKMEATVKGNAAAHLTRLSEAIFQELGKDAYEAKPHATLPKKLTGKKKEMILNAVYLVEREKTARFRAHGKRLHAKYASLGLDFEVTGPWPPYSFI